MKKPIALAAVALAVPLLLLACSGPEDTPLASADVQSIGADQVIYGMSSYLTASGVREGRVVADTGYVFFDSATVKLRGMRLVFYNADGTERATVTAQSGQLNENTDRMVAYGNVVLIVHADGSKIETATSRTSSSGTSGAAGTSSSDAAARAHPLTTPHASRMARLRTAPGRGACAFRAGELPVRGGDGGLPVGGHPGRGEGDVRR
jgi:LPS export ABC transporter protein LptC